MTAEKLSEALSFLDDDIIEETEALRSRKDRTDYKIIWLRCMSVAACLCIVLVAVFAGAGEVDLPLRGNGISINPSEEFKFGSSSADTGTTGILTALSVDEVAYLEITEWKENCFYATALDGKNDAFEDGATVKVKFNPEQVWVRQNAASGWNWYENRILSAEEFPVGSKVFVVFGDRRNTFLNSKADEVITAFVVECDGTERWK